MKPIPIELAERINREVNASLTYKTDLEQYGVLEKWTLPVSGFGDCEDYALLKKAKLMNEGFTDDSLTLATCFVGIVY